jgi:hypothetical protein
MTLFVALNRIYNGLFEHAAEECSDYIVIFMKLFDFSLALLEVACLKAILGS